MIGSKGDRLTLIIEQLKEARRIAAENPAGEMVAYLIDMAIVEAEEEQCHRQGDEENSP